MFNQAANMQLGHSLSIENIGRQKEKDSTANATLWRKAHLLYKINQLVTRNPNLVYEELQQLKRQPSLRGVVSYYSINLPSLRGGVNQVNIIDLVSYCSDDALVLRCWSSSCATLISNLISSLTFVPISSTRARASRDESSGSLQLPSLW